MKGFAGGHGLSGAGDTAPTGAGGGAGDGLGTALTGNPALRGALTPGPAPPPTPSAFWALAEASQGPVGAARMRVLASCAPRGAKMCCAAEPASGVSARSTPTMIM